MNERDLDPCMNSSLWSNPNALCTTNTFSSTLFGFLYTMLLYIVVQRDMIIVAFDRVPGIFMMNDE